ncbi:MAG TPA: hypothetical protein VN866_12065 [Mycobacterium sp.]|nr:hypothetical protein [Mycobacterium sp.]
MIKKLLTAAAVCAALTGGAAHASTFDFSYTFTDGQVITGSLMGTSTDGGQTVTNISDLQVSFDGVAFLGGQGPLQIDTYNPATETFTDTTPATISANGALNNFVISDVDAVVGTPDYEFLYINDPNPFVGSQVVAQNFLQTNSSGDSTQLGIDEPANAGAWTLTAATPVPLPATLPLLASALGGLGLFGIGRRRIAR